MINSNLTKRFVNLGRNKKRHKKSPTEAGLFSNQYNGY